MDEQSDEDPGHAKPTAYITNSANCMKSTDPLYDRLLETKKVS